MSQPCFMVTPPWLPPLPSQRRNNFDSPLRLCNVYAKGEAKQRHNSPKLSKLAFPLFQHSPNLKLGCNKSLILQVICDNILAWHAVLKILNPCCYQSLKKRRHLGTLCKKQTNSSALKAYSTSQTTKYSINGIRHREM